MSLIAQREWILKNKYSKTTIKCLWAKQREWWCVGNLDFCSCPRRIYICWSDPGPGHSPKGFLPGKICPYHFLLSLLGRPFTHSQSNGHLQNTHPRRPKSSLRGRSETGPSTDPFRLISLSSSVSLLYKCWTIRFMTLLTRSWLLQSDFSCRSPFRKHELIASQGTAACYFKTKTTWSWYGSTEEGDEANTRKIFGAIFAQR